MATTLMLLCTEGQYTVTLHEDGKTACEFVDELVRPLMLAAGYHESSIDEALNAPDEE